MGASTSWNPQDLSRPVQGLLYLYQKSFTLCTRFRNSYGRQLPTIRHSRQSGKKTVHTTRIPLQTKHNSHFVSPTCQTDNNEATQTFVCLTAFPILSKLQLPTTISSDKKPHTVTGHHISLFLFTILWTSIHNST